MKLKNEDALPKISDFAVWNNEGDFTAEILSGNKAVILATYLSRINTNHLEAFDEMVAGLQSANIEVVFVAASSEEEIQTFLAERNWNVHSYQADATVVKTIMRSNPGLMLLKEGLVLKKYHFRNTPSAETIKTLY
jgi:hypothetical protein